VGVSAKALPSTLNQFHAVESPGIAVGFLLPVVSQRGQLVWTGCISDSTFPDECLFSGTHPTQTGRPFSEKKDPAVTSWASASLESTVNDGSVVIVAHVVLGRPHTVEANSAYQWTISIKVTGIYGSAACLQQHNTLRYPVCFGSLWPTLALGPSFLGIKVVEHQGAKSLGSTLHGDLPNEVSLGTQ
jgi:hypothetical protein